MSSREEIIRGLYKNYKFLEEDFSKFRKMPCLSSVENPRDGVKKLSYCVRQEVIEHGLVDTFKKIERAVEIENALNIIYIMSAETGYVIQGADIMTIANVKEYKECFDTFIKQNGIKDVNSLNNREIVNEFLKNILTVRLDSKEIKEYIEEEGRKKRLKSRKPINYGMPFSKEQTDGVISTLSDEERSLIKKWEEGDELSKNAYCKIRSIRIKIEEKLKQTKKQDGEMLTSSTEELKKETSQQTPPVNNNPPAIEIPKPVFSDVIKRIQSVQKWDNVVTGIKEEKEEIKDKIVDENMPNKYYIVAYKAINADPSVIATEIGKLTKREINLIERKGRITLGVYDKILTPVEEEELKSILNKIRSNLGLEIMPQEKPKNISKTVVTRYKDIASSVGMNPEEWAAVKEKLSDNDKRIIKEKEEGKVLNLVDKNRCTYLVNSLKKGIIPKERLKKTSIYEDTPYPKEEVDKLIEKLSDNDKRIIKEKEEGNKLNRTDNHRCHYLIKLLKQGKIPMEKKPKKEKSSPPKKTGRKPISIYVLVPVDKSILDQYLIEKLSSEELEIIQTREKLIQEKRFDEIPTSYRLVTNKVVLSARRELMSKEKEPKKEKKSKKEKSSTPTKTGRKPVSIYILVPVGKSVLYQYLTETLTPEELKIIKTREKLIQENRYDEIPTSYRLITKRTVERAKRALMPKEKKKNPQPPKKKGRPPKTLEELTHRSKEEIEALREQLDDFDKNIIELRIANIKLTKDQKGRCDYIIKCFRKGEIPTRRVDKTKPKSNRNSQNNQVKPQGSIFDLVPVPKEVLCKYIAENLDAETQRIIWLREKIVTENSSETISKKEAAKFNKATIKAREDLIPLDDILEANKKRRNVRRKNFYEYIKVSATKEEIDEEIKNLSDEEKELVRKRINGEKTTTAECHKIRYIAEKIGSRLKKKRIQVLEAKEQEKLPISKKQLQEELAVPEESVNKGSKPIEKKSMITIGINQVLSPIPIQTSKEENDKLSTDYKRTLAEASNNPIVIKEIDMTDIYMTGIRYGFLNGYPKKSIDEIAEWFGKTPDEVERITDEVLEKLYYVIVNNFKNTKQSDEKVFVKTGEKNQEE